MNFNQLNEKQKKEVYEHYNDVKNMCDCNDIKTFYKLHSEQDFNFSKY